MATHVVDRAKGSQKHLESVLEFELALEFVRVVEEAAVASAHTMGLGDRHKADKVATEAMRTCMDSVPMRGTIVIGEGERDEAPMLYIGEHVGAGWHDGAAFPEVDIAVDPLEGTNLCATGSPDSHRKCRCRSGYRGPCAHIPAPSTHYCAWTWRCAGARTCLHPSAALPAAPGAALW